MKQYNESIVIKLESKANFSSITKDVQLLVAKSGIKNGFVMCFAVENTTALFIHIDDANFLEDLNVCLHKLAPEKPYKQYMFNKDRTDGAAHIKSHLLGRQVNISLIDGKLNLPPGNKILFTDFDNDKQKELSIAVTILGL